MTLNLLPALFLNLRLYDIVEIVCSETEFDLKKLLLFSVLQLVYLNLIRLIAIVVIVETVNLNEEISEQGSILVFLFHHFDGDVYFLLTALKHKSLENR